MVVAAAKEVVSFSKKKLLIKTKARFRAEHFAVSAYSYALRALLTHFFEGRLPSWINDVNLDNLSASTKKTIDMVKEAYGSDVYPAHPDLVLSIDGSTIFAFESKARGVGGEMEWDWKLIDPAANNALVRSDFEVEDDNGNSGGLCIRITFTFTASGSYAPLFICVSGLSKEELPRSSVLMEF